MAKEHNKIVIFMPKNIVIIIVNNTVKSFLRIYIKNSCYILLLSKHLIVVLKLMF